MQAQFALEIKLTRWAPVACNDRAGQGLRLGVVTNCSTKLGRRAAARCAIKFDAVVTAEEVGFYKPRPEPYRAVLAALNVSADHALFVAGSSADVAGAAAVGMPVVWHNRVGLPAQPGPKPLAVKTALSSLAVTVEHIGSTAVPCLAAKPVIDLDVVLASPADLPEAIRLLATVGYLHEGDLGVAGREAFRSPA